MRSSPSRSTRLCGIINRAVVIVAFAVVGATPLLSAATFTVTTNADSGVGTLRQAIVDANAAAGVDTIAFAIPAGQCSAAGVCTIALVTPLLTVTEGITLDGTTQPRYGTAPDNVCADSGAPSYMRVLITSTAEYMLEILDTSEPTIIRGLAFTGDNTNQGIRLQTLATTRVQCNHFGLNGEGTIGVDLGNGICLACYGLGGSAIIGTDGDGIDDLAERNVFGNVGRGVNINLGDDQYPNWIAGNYFGFAADGTTPANTTQAVYLRQSTAGTLVGSNLDGTSDQLERNVMGYFDVGVFLDVWSGVAYANHVVGNWIGIDARGGPAGGGTGIRVNGDSQFQDIRDNQIHSNWVGVLVAGAGSIDTGSGRNCIAGNTTGLQHDGAEMALFAENNYWGSTDGPSGIGPGSGDPIGEGGTGTVDFDPWLTSPVGVCTILFVDGFESGDTGAWSSAVP